MDRTQLEHVLRASAAITGAETIVVIGSQSVLGAHPDPPRELVASIEADLFTFRSPDDANLIDGSIGEGSLFHKTFGYYAHGVGPETATLPGGWRERLVAIRSPNTGGATGLCLEVHDLAVSKLVAGREKDLRYVSALLGHRLASASIIESRLAATSLDPARRELCLARLKQLVARSGPA